MLKVTNAVCWGTVRRGGIGRTTAREHATGGERPGWLAGVAIFEGQGGGWDAHRAHQRSWGMVVPYSGGAQGPSPLATLLATSSYHSSLVLPLRKPTMTMVMLSHPTPPVSELEARQLSIIFSQILSRSCLAAIPLRTNSTTAWEDWQSQIPTRKESVSQPQMGPVRL